MPLSGTQTAPRERLLALYASLVERPTDEQSAAIEQLHREDAELATQLEHLLGGSDTLPSDGGRSSIWDPDRDQGDDTDASTATCDAVPRIGPRSRTGPNRYGPGSGPGSGMGLDAGPLPELTHYRLLDHLGRGGAGQVFRAVDRRSGEQLAIKLLRPELVDNAKSVLRFRREFRAVARLDHPNCVRVIEEGVEGEHRYYVMEYLAGGDLRALVGAEPATLLVALIQVAAALDYIHAQRIVHRDIKPANVLLATREPPVIKLADFGIALRQSADVTQLTGTGQVVGTVDYMSPEQVEGQTLDPRSDLYSLGCMMWQLFAGRLPFEGSTVQRLVARVYGAATPLSQLRPELPPALSSLVSQLLAREPGARPQTALEVVQALARILSDLDPNAAAGLLGELPTDRAGAFLFQPPLVGHAAELERIDTLAIGAATGAPEAATIVAVIAAAGLGKSGLLEQLRRGPDHPRVLRVGVDLDQAQPLAPFPALATALGVHADDADDTPELGLLDEDELRRARSRHVQWLTTRLRLRASGDGATLNGGAARPDRPAKLVIAFDDMHAASSSAWELLAELANALGEAGPRPLLLITARPEASARLDELGRRSELVRIELSPLAEPELAQMLTAMLGVGVSEQPPGLAELVYGESGGSPLVVRSFLDDLVSRELLRRVPGGWVLASDLASVQGELRSGRELILARLSQLAPATLDVLGLAALVGAGFDTELLVSVAGVSAKGELLDDTQVLDALDEALRAGVIRSVAGPRNLDSFEFEHRVFVEALEQRVPVERRPSIHGAIARSLRARGLPATALVRHCEAGDDDQLAYAVLRGAAEEARRALDFEAATGHLQRALERASPAGVDAAERVALRELLAETLVVIGRASQAIPLLRQLIDTALGARGAIRHDPEHASEARSLRPETSQYLDGALAEARLRRKLGRALLLANETDAGLVALQGALAALRDRSPRTRAGLLLRIVRDLAGEGLRPYFARAPVVDGRADAAVIERALVHRELSLLFRYIDLERSTAHVLAYRRLADRSGDAALRVESLAWYAVALAFLGLTRTSARVDAAALHLAQGVHGGEALVRLEMLRSGCLILRGEFDEAFEELHRSTAQARACGDRFLIGFATSVQGWWHGMWGRFDLALDDFVAARSYAGELNLQWLRVDAGCGQCISLAVCGRFDASLELSKEVIEVGRTLGMPAVVAMATEAQAISAFLQGEYREAHTLEVRAYQIYREHHLEQAWGFSVHMFRYESLLLLETLEGPESVPDLVPELRRCARAIRRTIARLPLFRGYEQLVRGLICARTGRPRRAQRLFAQALDARARLPPSGWDVWVRMRVAFERQALGGHPDKVRAEFQACVDEAEKWAGEGMVTWLHRVQRQFGL